MQATPATWRMLVEAGWQGDARLRILCGGEALAPDLADALVSRGAELWNSSIALPRTPTEASDAQSQGSNMRPPNPGSEPSPPLRRILMKSSPVMFENLNT